jgi:site-specific recombinase XerD
MMPNALAPASQTLVLLAGRAAHYAVRAHGEGTRRAYRSAWRGYEAFCRAHGRAPLAGDVETVAMYAVARADAGLSVASLRVHLAAIRAAHRLAGVPLDLAHPLLAPVLAGIARSQGVRPRRQAAPALPAVLRAMLAARPAAGALGARDRAMLLLGFAAALRRSELVALRLGDVTEVAGRGLLVLVRRSKTDALGAGEQVAVCANPADPGFCPAAALRTWLVHRLAARDLAGAALDTELPLFCAITKSGRPTGAALSDKAVVRLVKQAAAAAGFDAAQYSGHSLRAGLATAAAEAGADLPALMRQTRHRSVGVALRYVRPAELWRGNVTQGLFGARTQP